MKKVMLTIHLDGMDNDQGVTIEPLGFRIGRKIDGSHILQGHGLDHSNIRTHEEALHIAEQIVDLVNNNGGIEITELEYEYAQNRCKPRREGWDCSCGRFDQFKKEL